MFVPEIVLRSLSGMTEECSSILCAFVAEIYSGSSAPERCCPAYSLKDLEVTAELDAFRKAGGVLRPGTKRCFLSGF